MAQKQLAIPGEIVKKHNALVRGKIHGVTVDGSRVLACLIASIRHDDTQFKDRYTVQVKDFISPDTSGRRYGRMKDLCDELSGATVEIAGSGPDEPPLLARFFSSITYREGVIEACLAPEMRPFLLTLKDCFTQYSVTEYLALPSRYSQKVFEILKSWSGVPEITLSVAELHHMLGTPSSFQSDFKALRKYVLEKAHKDIHEKTSLRFAWEAVKVGRSVKAVRFVFAPGRKAKAEKEAQKRKEEKCQQSRNQQMMAAIECARNKEGVCIRQDNKPSVCEVCSHFDICDGVRREKDTPTRGARARDNTPAMLPWLAQVP